MPTYEYRCADCDHTFDIVQSFTDDSLTVCPECGGRLKKVFGNIGISFKGSGFYVTDSEGAKQPSPAHSGASSDGSSGGSSDGSSGSSDSGSTSSDSSSGSSDSKSSSDTKAAAAAD